jgi:hypothetical protein
MGAAGSPLPRAVVDGLLSPAECLVRGNWVLPGTPSRVKWGETLCGRVVLRRGAGWAQAWAAHGAGPMGLGCLRACRGRAAHPCGRPPLAGAQELVHVHQALSCPGYRANVFACTLRDVAVTAPHLLPPLVRCLPPRPPPSPPAFLPCPAPNPMGLICLHTAALPKNSTAGSTPTGAWLGEAVGGRSASACAPPKWPRPAIEASTAWWCLKTPGLGRFRRFSVSASPCRSGSRSGSRERRSSVLSASPSRSARRRGHQEIHLRSGGMHGTWPRVHPGGDLAPRPRSPRPCSPRPAPCTPVLPRTPRASQPGP